MPLLRAVSRSLLTATLAACAMGETAPPRSAAAPATEPPLLELSMEVAPVAPAPAPLPSLKERWSAPFAVHSSGSVAPRPSVVLAVREEAPARAREAHPAASAASPAAAAPSRTVPREAPPTVRAGGTSGSRAVDAVGTHRVERGDTWYGLARRYATTPAVLSALNPGVDPERIQAGQVVRVPGADPAPVPAQRTHTVGEGDSLWGIARRYGVTPEAVRRANRLPDDRVRIGERLVIPDAEAER